MKVYMVMGGFNHEGMDFDSLEVFSDENEAKAYAEELVDGDGYFCFDYFEIKEREL